jgi:hypothetical protein
LAGAGNSSVASLTWRGWLSERLLEDRHQGVPGGEAVAARGEVDPVYRASKARVRDLIEACPERRDLVHGDLLHANVLVAEDASRPNAVFSWKCSLRGDFLFDTAWCTFCSAIWYPGIAAADPWDCVRRDTSVRDDADAWVDASERLHCYELHIGLTASAWNAQPGGMSAFLFAQGAPLYTGRAAGELRLLPLSRCPRRPRPTSTSGKPSGQDGWRQDAMRIMDVLVQRTEVSPRNADVAGMTVVVAVTSRS